MAQMIRKQIYIDADNERFLKERSSELGITEAEVVRQALAEAAQKVRSNAKQEAFDAFLGYIREHRMRDVPQSDPRNRWQFNREELYDEIHEDRFERPRRQWREAEVHSLETSST